jgi:hypothetical protein
LAGFALELGETFVLAHALSRLDHLLEEFAVARVDRYLASQEDRLKAVLYSVGHVGGGASDRGDAAGQEFGGEHVRERVVDGASGGRESVYADRSSFVFLAIRWRSMRRWIVRPVSLRTAVACSYRKHVVVGLDLWGREAASGQRWIFEAKTVRPGRELARVRSALAQLLEYRFLHGSPDDNLCLVTNGPIGDRHGRVLGSLGICVLTLEGRSLRSGSDITTPRLLQALGDDPDGLASDAAAYP